MKRPVLSAALALLAMAVALPSQAGMADSTPGAWTRWADKADAIADGLDAVVSSYTSSDGAKLDRSKLSSGCDGIRGMMIGTSYPLWAQGPIGVCDSVKFLTNRALIGCQHDGPLDFGCDIKKIAFERKTVKAACKVGSYANSQMHSIKPVDSEPRVLPSGQRLAASFDAFRKMLDC